MQPNQKVLDFITPRAVRPFRVQETDPGYAYAASYHFDVSGLESQVAVPGGVDRIVPISQAGQVRVDQCFIGTCTGGRLEDFTAAAEILRGKQIAPHVRLIVIPASTEVLQQCLENVDAIAAVEGLDGVFVGPMDLSCSLGYFADPKHPEVQAQIRRVEEAALRHGKFLGTVAGSMQEAQALYDRGYDLVVPMSDSTDLGRLALQTFDAFRALYPSR